MAASDTANPAHADDLPPYHAGYDLRCVLFSGVWNEIGAVDDTRVRVLQYEHVHARCAHAREECNDDDNA